MALAAFPNSFEVLLENLSRNNIPRVFPIGNNIPRVQKTCMELTFNIEFLLCIF